MKISPNKKPNSGKAFAGMILIIVGVFILLDNIGLFLPRWVISFPMFLIVLGLYIGSRNNYKTPGAFILIGIGTLFLVDKMFPEINFSHIFWPVMIIGAGVYMILSKERKTRIKDSFKGTWSGAAGSASVEWDKAQAFGPEPLTTDPLGDSANSTSSNDPMSNTAGSQIEDHIDSVSVFGGVKKNIMSKNFKGGDIVNFFGGAEINLIQADITGRVVLDVTQVFGGTKIIVPPHWEIHSEMAAVFGGIEDKRPIHPNQGEGGKVLTIRGTSIFGGIDIRSY